MTVKPTTVSPQTAAQLQQQLRDRGVRFAVAGYTDLHGNLKGKLVPIDHLPNMVRGSELFTGAALDGLPQDVSDQELSAHPDLASATVLPTHPEVAILLSDLYVGDQEFGASTRNMLNRQVRQAAQLGYRFNLGVETEFFVLREGNTSMESGSDRDLLDKPCYTIPSALDNLAWLGELVEDMNDLGWDVYSFDHEDARGQFEVDFQYADALTMADRVVLLRLLANEVARKHGLFASFMPKPFADRTGSGAHFNMSLADLGSGSNLFETDHDERGADLSDLGYHFAAGILRHAAAICAVIAPTVNSYKRLVPRGSMSGSTWAPVFVSCGNNNRTNMLRIPLGGGRVECRAVDASCNPHLAAAMLLAAGLEGIRERLEPDSFHTENLYQLDAAEVEQQGLKFLPRSLAEAIDGFEQDPLAHEVCGDAFVGAFVDYKRQEWQSYQSAITQWELDRYLKFF